MSPLEKVPFATFYPLQKYLRGTCFFQKRLFQVDSYIDVQGWFYVFNFIDWRNLFFQHYLRALSAKNANHLQTTDTLKRHQRYSIHYHCGWPSLGIWGSATHYGLPALPEPLLRACGLHRVCTGFAQGLYRVPKNQNSRAIHPAARFICNAYMLYVYGAHVTNRSKSFILDVGHWRPCRKFCQFHEFGNDEFLGIRQIIVILWKGICFSNGSG